MHVEEYKWQLPLKIIGGTFRKNGASDRTSTNFSTHAMQSTVNNFLQTINKINKSLTRIDKIGTLEFNTAVLKGFLLGSEEYH